MTQETKNLIAASVADFHLPRYNEIPNVGLYLEQTSKYISEFLAPLGDYGLTNSMISNYVKKGLVANPVKKQYDREQIAKTVLSLDALTGFIDLQKRTYPLEIAYDYFCRQFESLLQFTVELTDTMELTESYGVVDTEQAGGKRLLYSCIVAVTQKIYLEKSLEAIASATKE